MAPRPRQRSTTLPNGIKADALPAYVYWDKTGHGRWVLKRYDPVTQKLSTKRLAGPKSTLREIWDAYEAATHEPPADTMRALVGEFERSPAFTDLMASTQGEYQRCAKAILETQTKSGHLIANIKPTDWTPGSIRAYVDKRGETARSRANHELRYLRRLFAWAVERDMMPSNPARGVKVLKEPPRQRYVTDGEYTAFLEFAGARYPYLVPISELAYLCRLRLAEVLDLKRENIRDDGLFAARRKGSKDALTGWTPRLRAAVDAALALHGKVVSLYIIPGPGGKRMTETAVQTAWQRVMVEWAALGNERFTTHDLKRKGVSDAEGDKLAASGHRSAAMLKVYDVLPSKAPATK